MTRSVRVIGTAMRRAVLVVMGIATVAGPLAAQSRPTATVAPELSLPSTEVRTLRAAANDIEYKLYISKPPGYDTASARYPVVYLLDADYSFPVAHAVATHLTERSHLPPVVLVGVAYGGPLQYRLNRTRDYTPTFSPTGGYGPEYQRVSGGAPRFLTFLRRELIPFIDANYRTTDDRTLVGHSYGGLFTLWIALTEPALFDRLLAVSPSIWYDDKLLFRIDDAQRRAGQPLPPRLYMTAGDMEDPIMAADLRTFERRLRQRRSSSAFRAEVLQGETHNSIFPSGFSRGLRWLFQDLGAR